MCTYSVFTIFFLSCEEVFSFPFSGNETAAWSFQVPVIFKTQLNMDEVFHIFYLNGVLNVFTWIKYFFAKKCSMLNKFELEYEFVTCFSVWDDF